jgi:hypothetical protein
LEGRAASLTARWRPELGGGSLKPVNVCSAPNASGSQAGRSAPIAGVCRDICALRVGRAHGSRAAAEPKRESPSLTGVTAEW